MEETINVPYVKEYKDGILTNPIKPGKTGYPTNGNNRMDRRGALQKDRHFGESKNFHLTVHKAGIDFVKWHRVRQFIKLKDGKIKTIGHDVLMGGNVEN